MTSLPISQNTRVVTFPPLELHAPREICNQIKNGYDEWIYPTNDINPQNIGPMSFMVKGTSDFVDLNSTHLYIAGKFKGVVPDDSGNLIDIADASKKPFFSCEFFTQCLNQIC